MLLVALLAVAWLPAHADQPCGPTAVLDAVSGYCTCSPGTPYCYARTTTGCDPHDGRCDAI